MTGSGDSASPLVTVVTICKNAHEVIAETVGSVLGQRYERLEYIVVDGGSADGTLELVRQFSGRIQQLVSEPDRGIYDAMNKGARLARGEWVCFMNAGDRFCDDDAISRALSTADSNDYVVYGDTIVHYGNQYSKLVPAGNPETLWKRMVFWQQSTFVRRELLLQYPFDLRYGIAADFKFYLSAQAAGFSFHYSESVIAEFDAEGLSNRRRLRSIWERRVIVRELGYGAGAGLYYAVEVAVELIRGLFRVMLPEAVTMKVIRARKNAARRATGGIGN